MLAIIARWRSVRQYRKTHIRAGPIFPGPVALSADIDGYGALLHFTTVSDLPAANLADQQEAVRLLVHPHQLTPVTDVPGLNSVEMFPPGEVPGRRR